MFIEALDRRLLLTASVANGILLIDGTDNDDAITVDRVKSEYVVVENGQETRLAAKGVRRVAVTARGGSDNVDFSGNVRIPGFIDGGDGDDTLDGSNFADAIVGGDGDDQISGDGGNDSLYGLAGNDLIQDGTGSDRVEGGDDDDTFDAGSRAKDNTKDIFIGGDGSDVVLYDGRSQDLTVSLDDLANDGADGERDNIRSDVEEVRCGSGNDILIGNAMSNTLLGGLGADLIQGGAGDDQLTGGTGTGAADSANVIVGGPGFDSLIAQNQANDFLIDGQADGIQDQDQDETTVPGLTSQFDVFNAATFSSGGNRLLGLVAGATLDADGTLRVEGSGRRDRIRVTVAGGFVDVTVGGSTSSFAQQAVTGIVVQGRSGNDRIDVAANVNIAATLVGGAGSDLLFGGAANDLLIGGEANAKGADGADRLTGRGGTDTASYASRSDRLFLSLDGDNNDGAKGEGDNIADDVENITGGRGNDRITGNGGANALVSGLGRDTVRGGAGNDVIVSLGQPDVVMGEAGMDFIFVRDGGTRDEFSTGDDADDDTNFVQLDSGVDVDLEA